MFGQAVCSCNHSNPAGSFFCSQCGGKIDCHRMYWDIFTLNGVRWHDSYGELFTSPDDLLEALGCRDTERATDCAEVDMRKRIGLVRVSDSGLEVVEWYVPRWVWDEDVNNVPEGKVMSLRGHWELGERAYDAPSTIELSNLE
ncbi:MAG: hypothetical protein PVI21_04180 [Candidatus Woesebacteria bacterium]